MGWRVLVTARAFWVSGERSQQALEAAGCEVVWSPDAGPIPQDRLIPLLHGCQAVIASSDPYNNTVFDACPDLKLVARCGVGIDRVSLEDATRAGVVVANTPGAMTEAVADYTFGLMLAAARKIVEGDRLVRAGGWSELNGPLLYGKTLGLVGFGQIGQAVARRAAGFRMRTLAFDPPRSASPPPDDLRHVEFCSLETLLAESDFVSAHAPATPETVRMFGRDQFAQMKPSAFFVNTARGALVEEDSLREALEAGRIAGAALDVFAEEPLPAGSPLRQAPRLVMTPHNAFNAVEAAEEMSRQTTEHILRLLHGERPQFVCNPEVWSSPTLRVPAPRLGGQP